MYMSCTLCYDAMRRGIHLCGIIPSSPPRPQFITRKHQQTQIKGHSTKYLIASLPKSQGYVWVTQHCFCPCWGLGSPSLTRRLGNQPSHHSACDMSHRPNVSVSCGRSASLCAQWCEQRGLGEDGWKQSWEVSQFFHGMALVIFLAFKMLGVRETFSFVSNTTHFLQFN